jgi:hypothetical protein
MCCGNRRSNWQTSPGAALPENFGRRQQSPAAAPGRPIERRLKTYAEFEYTGPTALTVEGPVTGKLYRFGTPGALVAVDLLDRRAVAAVPHLREVRS